MKPRKILLVENQERYARMVLEQLRCLKDPAFEVVLHYQYDTAPSLVSGNGTRFDAVLFGFQGVEDIPSARKVLRHAEGKAIVVFLLKNNNKKTIGAVRKLGTPRFLIKRDVQARNLRRVLEDELEIAQLRSQPADEVVFDTQLEKASQMVESLRMVVRNPSRIVRLRLPPVARASEG
ncbi:MAG: hypothetical protein ACE5H0_02200 [Bacteroidota bacterium]